MKNYIVVSLLSVLFFPVSAFANDYGGWFNSYSPIDCFIIDNLSSVGYSVKVIYSEETAKNLGRKSTIAEAGKCYDSKSSLLILDGDEWATSTTNGERYEKTFSPTGESTFNRMGSYLSYFDIGLEYSMFLNSEEYPYDKIKQITAIVDQDFGKCDIRKRVETHTLVKRLTEEDQDEPKMNGTVEWGKEVWLLKDGTRKDAPTFPASEGSDYIEQHAATLAKESGCYDTLQIYKNGKTKELLNIYLGNASPDSGTDKKDISQEKINEIKEETVIKSVGSENSNNKQNHFQWWWPILGAGIIGGAVILKKKNK